MILQTPREILEDSPSLNVAMEELFYLPLDMDFSLHAAPAITLLLDFYLFERKYNPKTAKILAPLLALTYTVGYAWWVERCARNNGMCEYIPFKVELHFC